MGIQPVKKIFDSMEATSEIKEEKYKGTKNQQGNSNQVSNNMILYQKFSRKYYLVLKTFKLVETRIKIHYL